ncbi:alanine racemase, partial [bacterium]|nr:alanine racemase [bacterium]
KEPKTNSDSSRNGSLKVMQMTRRKFMQVSGATIASSVLGFRPRLSALSATPSQLADSWLEIDLNNIAWNLRQIRTRVDGRPVMAVIKANAYGHGLVEVGKFLEQQKIAFLAVGKFEEALRLREAQVGTPILNFGSFSESEAQEIVRRDISQSVYTDDFSLLSEAAQSLNRPAKVHIKIDTGLGRIGVPYYQALPFIEKVASSPHIQIEGIFTPFTEDDQYDQIQLQRFLEICQGARKKGISVGLRHAVSSAGILSFSEGYLDMVRPGVAIYGQYPSVREYQARKIDLRPAMSLKTRVMYVKNLRPGDSVSYHRAFVAQKETRLATISIGYSDGYPYQAGGKAEVLIGGRRWPSIALVTSNHATVDVTGAESVQIGDEVVLFGKQGEAAVSAEELAAWAGTSVYKILIWMNPDLPRSYLRT